MSDDFDRVTHHVIEHATALQRPLPEPQPIRSAQPERIDSRVGDHVPDRFVGTCIADVELTCECRRGSGVFFVRAVDSAHIDFAYGGQRLNVESGIESASYETNAEPFSGHV